MQKKLLFSVFFMFGHKNAEKNHFFRFSFCFEIKSGKRHKNITFFCDFLIFFLIKGALVCCAGTSCKKEQKKLDVCLNICFLCPRFVVTFSSCTKDKAISVKIVCILKFLVLTCKKEEKLYQELLYSAKLYLPELQKLTFLNTGRFTRE